MGQNLDTINMHNFRAPTPGNSSVTQSPQNSVSVFSPPSQQCGERQQQQQSVSPPKLTRERTPVAFPPRRRLFSPPDHSTNEDNQSVLVSTVRNSLAPPRDPSGLRSSSETSVFDFRDSDSESEMPVLERQTLDEMRRDRKSHIKHHNYLSLLPVESESGPTSVSEQPPESEVVDQLPPDPEWSNTCEEFLEQLRTGPERVKRKKHKKFTMGLTAGASQVNLKKLETPVYQMETQEVNSASMGPEIKTECFSSDDKQLNEENIIVPKIEVKVENLDLISDKKPEVEGNVFMSESEKLDKTIVFKNEYKIVNQGVIKLVKLVERKVLKEEGNNIPKELSLGMKDVGGSILKESLKKNRKDLDKKRDGEKHVSEVWKTVIKEEKHANEDDLPLDSDKNLVEMQGDWTKNTEIVIPESITKVEADIDSKSQKDLLNEANNIVKHIGQKYSKLEKTKFFNIKKKFSYKQNESDSNKTCNENIKYEETTKKKVGDKNECPKGDEKGLKKKKDESDEDVPLIRHRGRPRKHPRKEEKDVEDEISLAEIKARLGKQHSVGSQSNSTCGSESDEGHSSESEITKRLRRKTADIKKPIRMKLRSKELSKTTSQIQTKRKKKRRRKHEFTIGKDFRPGWEEEVYRFKRSLRMPVSLINIPRPPHRLSTSLPDLDTRPSSPADSQDLPMDQRESVTMDSPCRNKRRGPWSVLPSESDQDSTSNFSFIWNQTPRTDDCGNDSEGATSSTVTSSKVKNSDNNNSIVDFLNDRYNVLKTPKKKKAVKVTVTSAGITSEVSSSSASVTPIKETDFKSGNKKIDSSDKKKNKAANNSKACAEANCDIENPVLTDSVNKNSVIDFHEAFRQNSNILGDKFSSVVQISRTRTEARVIKNEIIRREIFGASDRPASAPPAPCEESTDVEIRAITCRTASAGLIRSNKAVLNSKRHFQGGRMRNHSLLRVLASKKLESGNSGDKIVLGRNVPEGTPLSKRIKIRTVRRKFRSGFDYIRKKKKQQKKDSSEAETPKERKKVNFLKSYVLCTPNLLVSHICFKY